MLSETLSVLFPIAGLIALLVVCIDRYSVIVKLKRAIIDLRDEFEGFKKQHKSSVELTGTVKEHNHALNKDVRQLLIDLQGVSASFGTFKDDVLADIKDLRDKFSTFKQEYSTVRTDVSKLGDAVKSVEDFGKKKFDDLKKLIKK